jgi:hypothetical protein
MFLKIVLSFRNKSWPSGILLLLLFFLAACAADPSRTLLKFTEVTISPDPLIGQVATLHLEFISDYDQPLTTVDIYLPEGIKLVKGDLNWKGSLTANQPQTHDISICTEFQGNYKIGITGRLWIAEDHARFTEPRFVFLDVTQTNVQVDPTALPQDWVSPCP